MSRRPALWTLDPDDPRAPSEEVWQLMTEAERQEVMDTLPSEFPPSEAHPPEGDHHTDAVYATRTALRRFFGKTGRSIYVGTNLPIYYPDRKMFSPDVMAVLDVPTHPRPSWLVKYEGRGLDFALEIIVLGSRRKDIVRNVELYAELGISEYFVFDWPRRRLQGFRLPPHATAYEPLAPQHGRFESQILGLELQIQGDRLRFLTGDAELPGADDLIDRLQGAVDDIEDRLAVAEARAEEETQRAEQEAKRAADEAKRAADEAKRAADEAKRATEEAKRADEAQARLQAALAEIERLKRELR